MFIIEEKIKKFLTIAEIINQKQKEMRDLLNLSTTEINEPISRLNDEIEELKKNLPSFTKYLKIFAPINPVAPVIRTFFILIIV